ncbi:MAG: HTTM domain-containing protein [Candidatus Sericytochromatia bacterium]
MVSPLVSSSQGGRSLGARVAGYEEARTWWGFLAHDGVLSLMSYGGLLFDALVVPMLLWRRTRALGVLAAGAFHVTNMQLFRIDVFPWLALAATTLFFAPDWPRKLLRGQAALVAAHAPSRPGLVLFLAAFMGIQAVVPLRHVLYPGPVMWTEEGHRFAWRMMARHKTGTARFYVKLADGSGTWWVDPADYLTSSQVHRLCTFPDMVLQFGHGLAEDFRRRGYGRVEVRAEVLTSVNGRPPMPLVDPRVDLAARPRGLGPSDWITMPSDPRVRLAPKEDWP